VLLAVIFCCKNAPDSQTGFEPGISQNNSAVFSRISDILGVGTPSQEDSLRRRSDIGKRVGFLLVLWGIPDTLKITTAKTGLLSLSPYSSPSKKRSASQKGIKRPVFLSVKLVIQDSKPANQILGKM
jgi:hypothetical protein